MILIIPAAVIFVLLLGISLLHTPPARHFILAQVHNRLLRDSEVYIQAAEFHFNLFTGKITLEDFTVRAAAATDLPPLFHADRVYLRPEVFSVIRGSWNLEELQIDAPRIHYFVGQDGKSNLPKTKASSSGAPEFLIAHAEVRDGSFHFEDIQKQFSLALPRWRLLVSGDQSTFEHIIDFTILQPASLQYRAQSALIEQVKLSGILQRNTFRADAFHVRSANSELSLTGRIRGFSRPEIDLQTRAQTGSARNCTQILSVSKKYEGNLDGTVHLDGTTDNLQITARIRGSNISALNYRRTSFDLTCRADWNPGRLRLHRVEMKSPDGSVSGSAELFADSGSGTNSIEASFRDFNLSPVWKLIRPPFDLASRATGKAIPQVGGRTPSAETVWQRTPEAGRNKNRSGSVRAAGSRRARGAASPRAHDCEHGAAVGARHKPVRAGFASILQGYKRRISRRRSGH